MPLIIPESTGKIKEREKNIFKFSSGVSLDKSENFCNREGDWYIRIRRLDSEEEENSSVRKAI